MYSKVYYKNLTVQSIYKGSQNIFTYDPLANIDPDALAYITNVEAADGQPLEDSVKIAFDDFVKNCKFYNIWDSIKSCSILAGARTLSGALVPLKGTAPTNYNFVNSDYHRGAGLEGDGNTKYLNSNRLNNDDPVNSKHLSIYMTKPPFKIKQMFENHMYIGSGGKETDIGSNSSIYLGQSYSPDLSSWSPGAAFFINTNAGNQRMYSPVPKFVKGCYIFSRNNNSNVDYAFQSDLKNWMLPALTGKDPQSSSTCAPNPIYIFGYVHPFISKIPAYASDARLSFYSIGESLDVVNYRTCIDILMNSLRSLFFYEDWAPPPLSATFVSYSIPLNVSVFENNYKIDQIGSNNPPLTCYRGTNYDFIVNTNSHPFALRYSLGDTSTEISGTYNNNAQNGVSNGTIWFTPNDNTPDTIYYQCTIHSSMNGTIYIKNY